MFTPPADGWTQLEKVFIRQLIINMYRGIKDPLDKFILIATTESCYKQDEISEMCGISQVAINKRLKKTRDFLKVNYA